MSAVAWEPEPWPTRECAPWCDRQSHDDEHPADRSCWSPFEHQISLSRRPPVLSVSEKEWRVDWIEAVLRRHPDADTPLLVLNDEAANWELEMTLDEAERLADAITTLIGLAAR